MGVSQLQQLHERSDGCKDGLNYKDRDMKVHIKTTSCWYENMPSSKVSMEDQLSQSLVTDLISD